MPTKEELLRKYKPINKQKQVPSARSVMFRVGFLKFQDVFSLLYTLVLSQQRPCPARFLYNGNLSCVALCEGTPETMLMSLSEC